MTSLTPDVVAAIDDLELAARLVVEGMRAGPHRSPFHGFSTEFDQHRPYRAGDDIKHLDWKLLARTDRLYTRQFRETTNAAVMLVLDASASMAFPERGVSKFRCAQILTAALAYLIIEQGDAAGLTAMSDGALTYLPARGGRTHLRALLAQLDRLEPKGRWHPASVIGRSAGLLRRRGVLVVLSDFYDEEEDTRRAMRRVARQGHDVAMLQIISADEAGFPYRGAIQFTDMELGDRRVVSAGAVEREYRERMAAFLERSRRLAHRDDVDYALLKTDVPPDAALRQYLLERDARHRSGRAAPRLA